MSRLEAFLSAEDLDDLLRAVRHLVITKEESERIASIVGEWLDVQAVSNLLFYPHLIPSNLRVDALDRAVAAILVSARPHHRRSAIGRPQIRGRQRVVTR